MIDEASWSCGWPRHVKTFPLMDLIGPPKMRASALRKTSAKRKMERKVSAYFHYGSFLMCATPRPTPLQKLQPSARICATLTHVRMKKKTTGIARLSVFSDDVLRFLHTIVPPTIRDVSNTASHQVSNLRQVSRQFSMKRVNYNGVEYVGMAPSQWVGRNRPHHAH